MKRKIQKTIECTCCDLCGAEMPDQYIPFFKILNLRTIIMSPLIGKYSLDIEIQNTPSDKDICFNCLIKSLNKALEEIYKK